MEAKARPTDVRGLARREGNRCHDANADEAAEQHDLERVEIIGDGAARDGHRCERRNRTRHPDGCGQGRCKWH